MPKFPRGFGRRKSAVNPVEEAAEAPPTESTFKVFERPDNTRGKSFDGGLKFGKAVNGPQARPKTSSHLMEGNMFENLGKNR